jgi:hypothetical protein
MHGIVDYVYVIVADPLDSASVQKEASGPPMANLTKPQLTRAERRAIQVTYHCHSAFVHSILFSLCSGCSTFSETREKSQSNH